jgi:outer membrane protein insertion porin family
MFSSCLAQAQETFEVTDIRVNGLTRIAVETIYSYLPVGIGDKLDEEQSRNAVKALFKTGFFKDIKLYQDGGILVINVIERPTIATIRITGNNDLDDERIDHMLNETGLIEGRIISESFLDHFLLELKNYYVSKGYYGSEIESALTPLDQNRVGVDIQIKEGPVARVREIRIVGNTSYDRDTLRKKSTFYGNILTNLLVGRNKYSKSKLDSDLEGLRNFYLDRGFLDFEILSNDISISKDKKDVLLTIELSEGIRFRVGQIAVDGTEVFSATAIRALLEVREGMIFSRRAIVDSRAAIERKFADVGYAFANVNPVPEPNRNDNIVNITFVIDPGPKVYVRRINIGGNLDTQDVVIRREMRQLEGALFSGRKIQRSQERIHRLGFFEEVSVGVVPVPGVTDKVDLDFNVLESKTGNLVLGIGYSDDERAFIQSQVSRKNLFGSGRSLEISLDRSQIKQSYELEYVNPYYTADGISRSVFARQKKIDASFGATAGYIANTTAFGMRYRLPTSEYNALDVSGSYENIGLVGVENTPKEYTSFIAEHPNNTGLVITSGFSRDTRDKILFPERGYFSKVAAETTIPGSDLEYYKLSIRAQWYRTLADSIVLGLSGSVGYGGGYAGSRQLPFYKNFFAGGSSSVRGFSAGSLGPKATTKSFGEPLGGNRRILANANFYFPVPGLENGKNTRLSVFVDAGQVYGDAEPVSFSGLRSSVGLAFNWFTAIGPLALSYGIPLNAEANDRTRKFQITLGTLFR